ncbi:thiamine pyrophosphokinase [Bacteroidia bacterium]|nr:thiamine pyrophosphokinase [Bacteroidia bacterium]
MQTSNKCVIMANGSFPTSPLVLDLLRKTKALIACDGAVAELHRRGFTPDAIVGDLDSIPGDLRLLYADRLHGETEQDSNDLTKAVRFAKASGYDEALILGATGLREDHTLGNISLLLDYVRLLRHIEMITDYGRFTPILTTTTFESVKGQQVSIFTPRPEVKVSTMGLRWPIDHHSLTSWWQGTLNEALGNSFTITLTGEGGAIIFVVTP